MADKGFYQVTERLYDLFKAQGFKTVLLDQQSEIDLKRQSIYPLAHIVPIAGAWASSTNVFGFLLMALDITDFNKDDPQEEELYFYGIDNRQDILHALHEKLRNVIEDFVRGSAYDDNMQITLPVSPDPIIDEFDNVLTGWTVVVNITLPSNATIC